jgi:hypothetical protein
MRNKGLRILGGLVEKGGGMKKYVLSGGRRTRAVGCVSTGIKGRQNHHCGGSQALRASSAGTR